MNTKSFLVYLFVMAGVTYLLRVLPLLLIKKRINNKYVLSFMHYIPYSVLTVMTIPAIFYGTGDFVAGVLGFIAAALLSLKTSNLIYVASGASAAVILYELISGLF